MVSNYWLVMAIFRGVSAVTAQLGGHMSVTALAWLLAACLVLVIPMALLAAIVVTAVWSKRQDRREAAVAVLVLAARVVRPGAFRDGEPPVQQPGKQPARSSDPLPGSE